VQRKDKRTISCLARTLQVRSFSLAALTILGVLTSWKCNADKRTGTNISKGAGVSYDYSRWRLHLPVSTDVLVVFGVCATVQTH